MLMLLTASRGGGGGRRVELVEGLGEFGKKSLLVSIDGIEGKRPRRLSGGLVVVVMVSRTRMRRRRRRLREGGLKRVELEGVEGLLLSTLREATFKSRARLLMVRMREGRETGGFGGEAKERHADGKKGWSAEDEVGLKREGEREDGGW